MLQIGQLVKGVEWDNVMYHDIAGLVGIIISKPNFYGQYCVYIDGMKLWILKDYLEVINEGR